MSIYEQRLESDLKQIRLDVETLTARVEENLENAIKALREFNLGLANHTILRDLPINRASRALDQRCHYFIARHLPSAGHLRYISSVMRANLELERVGDYAVTVCKEVRQLSRQVPDDVLNEVLKIAQASTNMLKRANRCFLEGDDHRARQTMGKAYEIDRELANTFKNLVREGRDGSSAIKDLFSILIVMNRLERVSDQAKNICEETVFAVTGQSKKPKVYRVLFLEEGDDCRSQMALAIARKGYSEQGYFQSAGSNPSVKLSEYCQTYLSKNGFDTSLAKPQSIDDLTDPLSSFHVIVSLDNPVKTYLKTSLFQPVFLNWDIINPSESNSDKYETDDVFESIYKQLSVEIASLVELLRGDER